MNNYRHTQVGWSILVPVFLIIAVAAAVPLIVRSQSTVPLLVTALLIVVVALFSTLTVTVTDHWLTCHFGIGLISRRILLSDVRSVKAVRNKWFYGWGIRLTPHGWLWNVSGLDAVEITLTNDKKFRIGTDEPEQLSSAIRRQIR